MKIAYMMGSLHRGGTETLVLEVFRHASRAGFTPLCLYRKGGSLAADVEATGVETCRLAPRFPGDPRYLRRLRKALLHRGVAGVHAQQPLDAAYALWALRGTGVGVVLTLHGYAYPGRGLREGLLRRILRRVLCKVRRTVFVSAAQREAYVRTLGPAALPRTEVVYNGLSFAALCSPPLRSAGQGPEGARRLQLGTVGSFVPVRDPLTLCRFLSLLHAEGLAFDFYFVGRRDARVPGLYEACVQYCQTRGLGDAVHFLGERADVPALLASWDAFLYSTDHDTFGLAVVEALAAGLPVFVNDAPVFCEVTRQGAWATLYKTGDAEDLLQKFRAFRSDPGAFARRAAQAAPAVRAAYSLEAHLEALRDLYARAFVTPEEAAL